MSAWTAFQDSREDISAHHLQNYMSYCCEIMKTNFAPLDIRQAIRLQGLESNCNSHQKSVRKMEQVGKCDVL